MNDFEEPVAAAQALAVVPLFSSLTPIDLESSKTIAQTM
jgi:hypothetical protein